MNQLFQITLRYHEQLARYKARTKDMGVASVRHGDNDNDDGEEDDDNHGGNKKKKKWAWLRILDVEEIRVNLSLIFREFANCAVLVTSSLSPRPYQQQCCCIYSSSTNMHTRALKLVYVLNDFMYVSANHVAIFREAKCK